jgi:hypothetical protein
LPAKIIVADHKSIEALSPEQIPEIDVISQM